MIAARKRLSIPRTARLLAPRYPGCMTDPTELPKKVVPGRRTSMKGLPPRPRWWWALWFGCWMLWLAAVFAAALSLNHLALVLGESFLVAMVLLFVPRIATALRIRRERQRHDV